VEECLFRGSSWISNIDFRLSGDDGVGARFGGAFLASPRASFSICKGEPSLFSVVLDVLCDGRRSSRDIDKPLLALRGKCCWILAWNECLVCSCGRSLASFKASIGLAARVRFPESHLKLSSSSRPSSVDPRSCGETMLREVRSVSAWEKHFEIPSLSIEVSPLRRLCSDPRCSVGLRMLWKLFETMLSGKGGTGCVGAKPDCRAHRLVDPVLILRGGCRFTASAFIESASYSLAWFPAPVKEVGNVP